MGVMLGYNDTVGLFALIPAALAVAAVIVNFAEFSKCPAEFKPVRIATAILCFMFVVLVALVEVHAISTKTYGALLTGLLVPSLYWMAIKPAIVSARLTKRLANEREKASEVVSSLLKDLP